MNEYDIVDRVAGLTPASPAYLTRHKREKVVTATQLSDAALFDPALPDLSLSERLLVALYACALSQAPQLVAHYSERLVALAADPVLIGQAARGEASEPRLQELLRFTHALITDPVKGDKAALQRLPAAGLSTPAVVALAQLIAYVSYQIRLVAGLRALDALNAPDAASSPNPAEPV